MPTYICHGLSTNVFLSLLKIKISSLFSITLTVILRSKEFDHGMEHLFRYNLKNVHKSTGLALRTVVSLSYKVIGEATCDLPKPPIFIFHSILSNKTQWEAIGRTIVNITRRIVVSVDLRNHGASPHSNSHKYTNQAHDMLSLLEKLGVKQASLIGHGMGGRTAMCLALIAPEKVSGLLVVDISPISSPPQYKENVPKMLAAMKAVDFTRMKNVTSAVAEAKKQLRESQIDETFMKDILSNIRLKSDGTIGWICNLEVLIKEYQYWVTFPSLLKCKIYDGPTLFIGGQHSDYLPPDDLIQIRELFPRAVITYVRKTGHFVHVDDPKTFLELTISFIRTNSYNDSVLK